MLSAVATIKFSKDIITAECFIIMSKKPKKKQVNIVNDLTYTTGVYMIRFYDYLFSASRYKSNGYNMKNNQVNLYQLIKSICIIKMSTVMAGGSLG